MQGTIGVQLRSYFVDCRDFTGRTWSNKVGESGNGGGGWMDDDGGDDGG